MRLPALRFSFRTFQTGAANGRISAVRSLSTAQSARPDQSVQSLDLCARIVVMLQSAIDTRNSSVASSAKSATRIGPGARLCLRKHGPMPRPVVPILAAELLAVLHAPGPSSPWNRQDQRCVFSDHQGFWRDIDALRSDGADLLDQMPRVQHDAIADDTQLAATHHAQKATHAACRPHHR